MSRTPTQQEQVREYIERAFSPIPIVPHGKTPLREALPLVNGVPSWKPYQTQAASTDEVLQWFADYSEEMGGTGLNIGLATGYHGLYVVDIDGPVIPPSLAAMNTTTVKTGRPGGAYHLYFKGPEGIRSSVLTVDGIHCEFRGLGQLVVAPVSIHASGTSYMFLNSLDIMKALPSDILKGRTMEPLKGDAGINDRGWSCLRQIWERPLVEGERDLGLYALYQGLISARHNEAYARNRLYAKNKALSSPLSERELAAIVRRGPESERPGHTYGIGCSWIKANIPWINCQGCRKANREAKRMINAYEFNKAYDDLNGSAFKLFIALIKKEQQTGQRTLSVREAETITGYSHRAIQEAFKVLKDKGYL